MSTIRLWKQIPKAYEVENSSSPAVLTRLELRVSKTSRPSHDAPVYVRCSLIFRLDVRLRLLKLSATMRWPLILNDATSVL